MKYTPEFLDEIRARLPVSEVVGARVKLRKQGREWAGLSPFQAEKTPSFFVNDQKGFYHDFSSGKHGDIYSFLMESEGLSFPDAVERLAAQAGVALPVATRESQEREQRRVSLLDVMALAARHFESNLQQRIGAKARGYLADRQLDAGIQNQFGLGFATGERFGLRDALGAQGVTTEQMIAGGLLIHGEDIATPYDRFRDRVMFPIHDRAGRVIAFGGRALEAEAKPKYLNSPETELFHKGGILFNHHRARKAAHEGAPLIVVEGYVDVIALARAGYPGAVAPLGTALTPEQCALLWSMSEEPILCFDGDKAGRKAAFRALDTALPMIGASKSLRFAHLQEGEDPDDLVRSGGPDALAEVIGGARPLADILFQRERDAQLLDTPERRAGLERRLRELTGKIADETLRRHYRSDMSARLAALFGPARLSGASGRDSAGRGPRRGGPVNTVSKLGIANAPMPSPQNLAGKRRYPAREIIILAAVLGHPALLETYYEPIARLDFASSELGGFRTKMLGLPAGVFAAAADLAEGLGAAGCAGELAGILRLARAMPNWWCLRPEAVISDAELVLQQSLALHRRFGALHTELVWAEKALADDPTVQNFERLRDIKTSLADLANAEAAVEGFGDLSGRAPAVI